MFPEKNHIQETVLASKLFVVDSVITKIKPLIMYFTFSKQVLLIEYRNLILL